MPEFNETAVKAVQQFRVMRDSRSVHLFERSGYLLSNQEKTGIMIHEYLQKEERVNER